MQKALSAGLYIRLSKEDEKDGPSESVTNQRLLLEQYAQDCQIDVYDIYVDDGWSGCNFDRPAFRRMLTDIECGCINTVITKDLSRLGRDYILTGHYLERYFPEHGVRYISLLDGIDTGSHTSANDITPFRAIMNDLYARDISRKITAVKRDKQKRGEFIGGKPVYGYRTHPTEKNHLVIDESAATVVRNIFTLAASCTSCREIADQLNREQIPSPSVYAGQAANTVWSGERIREMLQNELYLGNMVQGRRVKASYKSTKCLRQRKEDWIIVENTHEPIIDRDTFDSVQRILQARKRTRCRTYSHPLKGMIRCSECGQPLGLINRKSSTGEDTLYFLCRTHQRENSNRRCASRCVKASTITGAVLSTILSVFSREFSPSKLLHTAEEYMEHDRAKSHRPNQDTLSLQLRRVNEKIDRICHDELNGLLEREDFARIYRELLAKRSALTASLAAAQDDPPLAADQIAAELTGQFLQEASGSLNLLAELIEQIELTADRQLHITFRFSPDL